MTFRLRAAGLGDHAAMREVFERAVAVTGRARYSAPQVRAWIGERPTPSAWSARLAGLELRVAELPDADAGRPVLAGFVGIDGDGHVDLLFVAPGHGRRGIGAALLEEAIAHARAAGHGRVTTDASLVARPVFARRGLVEVGRQRVPRGGEVLVNVRMALDLDEPRGG